MCEHKYVFIESIKSNEYDGFYNTVWEKIDRFHCEKCLDEKTIKQKESSRDKPEWY